MIKNKYDFHLPFNFDVLTGCRCLLCRSNFVVSWYGCGHVIIAKKIDNRPIKISH